MVSFLWSCSYFNPVCSPLCFQDSLQQLILMTLPNVLTIAKDPLSGTVVLILLFTNSQQASGSFASKSSWLAG